ncbi:TfoX/Sxy family protein [Rhodovulum visakhapatnamense]|uniref:TfoX-like protein n=1 Tax=Rhodovulum visakhapatnamense TaxID=364297 RepID=A0A4R8G4I4_9RHOB|nr:TfoX/Sxy family protein [Rhodovulum visakhapatnamense]TDX30051.1 TfoX-like protein [Rhodovulum visakhapatnamense]
MAFDEGLAAELRGDLNEAGFVTERRMFGGLCFLLESHKVCGAFGEAGFFRVCPDRAAEALALPGTRPFASSGRRMTGVISVDADLMADDARRGQMLALALAFVRSLPPKQVRQAGRSQPEKTPL